MPEFRQPDVVLVDGRFREGCALAAAFLAEKPLTLLFDDYAQRKQYHKVEEFLGRPEMTGRMARFEITPQPVPAKRLLRIMQLTMRPCGRKEEDRPAADRRKTCWKSKTCK